jgi:hypothetical protein
MNKPVDIDFLVAVHNTNEALKWINFATEEQLVCRKVFTNQIHSYAYEKMWIQQFVSNIVSEEQDEGHTQEQKDANIRYWKETLEKEIEEAASQFDTYRYNLWKTYTPPFPAPEGPITQQLKKLYKACSLPIKNLSSRLIPAGSGSSTCTKTKRK